MRSRVLPTAAGGLLLALLAAGQQVPPPKPDAPAPQSGEPTRISVEVTRVSMAYSVTDKKGRFVTGLAKEDFELLENGKQQQIQEFAAESALPLRVAVLIDTSNSIRERFRFEQQAAIDFLSEVLRSNADKAMVVSFDSTPQLAAPLTDDGDRLRTAIDGLRPGGGTSLYDAVQFASQKLAEEQPSYRFRRIMVIVSDGDDNQSHGTRDQALEAAQVADTFVYAISTNNLSGGDTEGDKVLKYYAGQTGGKTFFPFKVEDLAQNFEIIAEEVRHQYSILYRPEPLLTDGLFHRVEIRVKGHKELTVRARSGYFARKAQ
jgi:VWFA-related protein